MSLQPIKLQRHFFVSHLFPFAKQFVSWVETVCFVGGNKVFPIEKQQPVCGLTIFVDNFDSYL